MFNNLLIELAKMDGIANFAKGPQSEASKDNREPEEQVLRYFALGGDLSTYADRLSIYLDEYMESKIDITDAEIDAMRNAFQISLANCESVFGENVFKDTTRAGTRQSMVYYDLLMPSLGALIDDLL